MKGGPVRVQVGLLFFGVRVEEYRRRAEIDVGLGHPLSSSLSRMRKDLETYDGGRMSSLIFKID